MVLSCFVVMVTHDTMGWTTILLVWLGHVTVTGAELFQSAGHWGSRPSCRSRRAGPSTRAPATSAAPSARVWAPALFTFLAMEWGTSGWLMIAAIVSSPASASTRRPGPPSATWRPRTCRGRRPACLNPDL